MTDSARSPARGRWIELAASAALLVATLVIVGTGPIWTRLRGLDVGWLAAGLAITVVQFFLLAARWWFVARRLDVPLSYPRALGEYYLSALLNYVVPFGFFGDALRAVRHNQRASQTEEGPSAARIVLAILTERASGQMALFIATLCIAPGWLRALSTRGAGSSDLGFAGLAMVVAIAAASGWLLSRKTFRRLRGASRTMARVLFGPATILVHLPLSFALLATHVLLFVVAARSIGLDLAMGPAFRFVPPILVASSLPSLLGGFGTREAAAAALYHLANLPAADGATVSLVYGGISVLGSTPGFLVLAWRRRQNGEEEPASGVLG